jgi:DNA-binding MurR/RpiR family transcriptional regulator
LAKGFAPKSGFLAGLREALHELPRAEHRVAERILDDPDSVLSLSISELAEQCGVADATIIRLARRLGLSGYQEAKILIAADHSDSRRPPLGIDVDPQTEMARIVALNTSALEATAALLDPNVAAGVGKRLSAARLVAVYGVGTSALAARYLAYRLTRIGVNATFEADAHYQVMATVLMDQESAAVAFSQSGSTYSVVSALRAAKESGSTTVAVTRFKNAPMTAAADVTIQTGADEEPILSGALPGLVSQLAVADVLAVATGWQRPATAADILALTAQRVANLKF